MAPKPKDIWKKKRQQVLDTFYDTDVDAYLGIRLGLDCGGVMARKFEDQPDHLIYKSCDPGFFAFMVLWGLAFGFQQLFMISRTNGGFLVDTRGKESWVFRFVKAIGMLDLGVPEDNLHVCTRKKGPEGKGPPAKHFKLTYYIDNDEKCLEAVCWDRSGKTTRATTKLRLFRPHL